MVMKRRPERGTGAPRRGRQEQPLPPEQPRPRRTVKRPRARVKWGRVTLLFGLLASIAILAWVYLYTDTLHVDIIDVEGNSRTEASYLERLSGLSSTDNLLTFDRGKVISNLMQEPWVKEVRVRKDFPNRVVLVVTEREPLGQVAGETGYYLVDETGFLIAASPSPWPDVPLLEGLPVEGLAVTGTVTGDEFAEEMEVFRAMDETMRARTARIIPRTSHGMVLVTGEDVQIYLGDLADLGKKLGTAFLILDEMLVRYGNLSYIDVSSPANPVIMPI
jgi:cell division protein FtsQ